MLAIIKKFPKFKSSLIINKKVK